MLEFGSLLRVCRSHWGLTQTEMAELLCISQPVYSRIEAGLRPVSLKALKRVADSAKIPVHVLILAHLLLDENLAAMELSARDPATKNLLAVAGNYRDQRNSWLKDAAALGLLFDGASE